MKIFAVCIGIIIVFTILMIASFIYRLYWETKLRKEAEMIRKGGTNEKDSL